MRFTISLTVGLSAVLLTAAACGGGAPPPPPEPVVDSAAIRDSIARAEEARRRAAEEEARRREAERIEAARRDSLARVEAATRRVREMIQTRIHFDYDRATIREGDAGILDQKLSILQANPNLRIRITGHCDERGSDEYNLALGNRRALAAKEYLVSRGVADNRIETASMGEEQPAATGSTEADWSQNRRDEFAILAGGDMLRAPQGM